MSIQTVASAKKVQLDQIGQIAITVADLARSKQFYRDKLGMKLLFEFGTMAFFQCGAVRLLLGTPEPGKAVANGGTILYFKVDGLEAVHAALSELEVPTLQAPHLVATMPDHELWMAFATDPDGNPVGLMSEVPLAA